MAISKIGSRGVIDGSVLAADFAPGTITNAKLAGSIENSKLSNSTFTISGESITLGGTDNALNLTDWQSKITSDGSTVTTMVSGRGYFVDNSSAAGLVKLPASASRGDFVQIKDYAGNFGTNNLTVQRNSHNIQGLAADSTIDTNRASVTLVYVDSTKGWLYTGESNIGDLSKHIEATGGTVTTSGDFKIHTFTGDGCFVVSQLGPDNTIDYLVLAGGGGGANTPSQQGGGGGGGGLRSAKTGNHGSYTVHPNSSTTGVTITAATFPITVGGGGAAPTSVSVNGSNSVFSTITSAGGGRGGTGGTTGTPADNGGSGGGGGWSQGGSTGNTPPVTPPQGGNGGRGNQGSVPTVRGGAGGGAGSGNDGTDLNVPGNSGGVGGAGATNHITGSPVVYGSGGGGGGLSNPTWNTSKGTGGTGAGDGADNSAAATSATANRGGGGGGASGTQAGSAGGSGVVIIRYKYQN